MNSDALNLATNPVQLSYDLHFRDMKTDKIT